MRRHRHRLRWLLLAGLLVTLAAAAVAVRVDLNLRMTRLLSDADRDLLRTLRSQFGNEDVILIGVRGRRSAVDADRLRRLQELEDQLESLPQVGAVWSLASAPVMIADGQSLELTSVAALDSERPPRGEDAPTGRVHGLAAAKRLFLGADDRTAIVTVRPEALPDGSFSRRALVRDVRAVVDRFDGPEDLVLSGNLYAEVVLMERARATALRLLPLTVVLVAGLLWYLLRSATLAGLLIVSACAGIAWMVGGLALMGVSFDVLTVMLPGALVALGSAYGMHVIAEFAGSGGRTPGDMFVRSRRVTKAVLVSAATTVIGFLSLALSEVELIRKFALVGALGTALVAVSVLWLLPPLLELWGPRRQRSELRTETLLARIANGVARARGATATWLVVGVAVVGTGWGISLLQVETSFLEWVPPDAELRRNFVELNEAAGGVVPLRVVVELPESGDALRGDVLAGLEELEQRLEAIPGVSSAYSLSEVVGTVWGALRTDTGPRELRSLQPGETAQLLLIVQSSSHAAWLDELVDRDYRRVSLTARTRAATAPEAERVLEAARSAAENLLPGKVLVGSKGLFLFTAADEIAGSLVRSLVVALLGVGAVLWLVFRSPRLVAIAVGTNVLPVAGVLGAMGFASVDIDLATALVGALALGIVVDDSVHLLLCYRDAVQAGDGSRHAAEQAVRTVGVPVLWTTLVVIIGFGVFGIAELYSIRMLGLLMALAATLALAVDLWVLPHLAARWGTRPVEGGAGAPEREVADPERGESCMDAGP